MPRIRSIGIFSAAKINAILYGILGLLLAPFLLLGTLGGDESKRMAAFGGAILLAAILPVFYGVVGFIAGAIFAFLYNAISHAIGGLEVELEVSYAPVLNPPQVPIPSPASSPSSTELAHAPPPEFE